MAYSYKSITFKKLRLNRVYKINHSYYGNTLSQEDNDSYVVVKGFTNRRILLRRADGLPLSFRGNRKKLSTAIPVSTRGYMWGLTEVEDNLDEGFKVTYPHVFNTLIDRFISISDISISKDKFEEEYRCYKYNDKNGNFEYLCKVVPFYYYDSIFDLHAELPSEFYRIQRGEYGIYYGFRYNLNSNKEIKTYSNNFPEIKNEYTNFKIRNNLKVL